MQLELVSSMCATLQEYHDNFTKALIAKMEKWDSDSLIGDTFTEAIDVMPKAYIKFSESYFNLIKTINSCRSADSYNFGKCEVNSGIKVEEFFDQIGSYPSALLNKIEDCIKYTRANHPDYHSFQVCWKQVNNTADAVSKSKKDGDNKLKVKEVQAEITGCPIVNLFDGKRKFVRLGNVQFGEKKKLKEKHAYILSDMVIICAIKKGKLQYEEHIQTKDTTVTDDETDKNAFLFSVEKHKFRFAFDTQEIRNNWFEDLATVLQEEAKAVPDNITIAKESNEDSFSANQLIIKSGSPKQLVDALTDQKEKIETETLRAFFEYACNIYST